MTSKEVKLHNIVTAKLYDKARWINTKQKEYYKQSEDCIVLEINPESDHPYYVAVLESKGCQGYDYWLTRDEILEVRPSGLE